MKMNEKLSLQMNEEALKEIEGIRSNSLLNVQVLCILQLLSNGFYIPVELETLNNSVILGNLHDCSGHSFTISSKMGFCAVIFFTDIKKLEISNLKIGA